MPDILPSPELLALSFGGILVLIAAMAYRTILRKAEIDQLKPVPVRKTHGRQASGRSNLPH